MKTLEDVIKPTQEKLFIKLKKKYEGKACCSDGAFILVEGIAPIMLVAHLDTVHTEPVKTICASNDDNILMSPQGIGGDDRCGVYALSKLYETAKYKPWLLYTCDEEVGGIGAEWFSLAYNDGKFPKALDDLKLIVEIDRRGSNDAVYYDCDNSEFEKYITGAGFETSIGSFSDISIIAPELGVAAVNLSSGYYNAHTKSEYIDRQELENVISRVAEIIADSMQSKFPRYRYIQKVRTYKLVTGNVERTYKNYTAKSTETASTNSDSAVTKISAAQTKLPREYEDVFYELLDLYTEDELNFFRSEYGDQILYQIYFDERDHLYRIFDEDYSLK